MDKMMSTLSCNVVTSKRGDLCAASLGGVGWGAWCVVCGVWWVGGWVACGILGGLWGDGGGVRAATTATVTDGALFFSKFKTVSQGGTSRCPRCARGLDPPRMRFYKP